MCGILAALAVLLLPALASAQAADAVGVAGAAADRPGMGLMAAFYLIGGMVVMGAMATITRRNPVVAAICLVGTLIATAGLYLLLHATFMAVIQVMVYAGAIMVLFTFVIMAVDHPEREELGLAINPSAKIIGVLAVIFLFFRALTVLMGPEVRKPSAVADSFGDVHSLGAVLFSEHLLPFEAISVLLLTAIVGAVVVSRRSRQAPGRPMAAARAVSAAQAQHKITGAGA